MQVELQKPGGRTQARRLELLREFILNSTLIEAAKRNEWRAEDILRALIDNKGDFAFYQEVEPLLASIDAAMAKREMAKLRRSLPTAELSKASAFPPETFLPDTQSNAALSMLRKFVGDAAYLDSRNITRKIFAFMGANPQLSQVEKINFCKNLMRVVHEIQQNFDPFANLIVFESFQSKKGDGAHIFCGHRCTFFFVVDKEGGFYSGRSYKHMSEDSTSEILTDWRDFAEFIYKAGKEAPEKESNLN